MLTAQGFKLIDIDFSKSDVVSRLTSRSLAEMTEHDISELRYLLNRAIKKSVIDVNLIEKHESAIRASQSLSTAMAAVTALLEDCRQPPQSTGNSEPQSTTSNISVGPVSKKPFDMLLSLEIQADDAEVLVAAAQSILSGDNNRAFLNVPRIVDHFARKGRDYQSVMDSIEMLRKSRLLVTSSGPHARSMRLTTIGLDAYLRCFDENYSQKLMSISAAIVFHEFKSDRVLSESLKLPIIFVHHAMDVFDENHFCQVMTTSSGRSITSVSVKLRRAAEKDRESGFVVTLRR